MNEGKRKIGEYTVLCSVNVGEKEVILASNEQSTNGDKFMCGFAERNDLFELCSECMVTKEKAERSVNANSSSAEEYASDKLESGIDEVFHDGAYAFDKAGRKGLETTKENIRTAKDGIQRFKQQRAEQSLRKQASQNTSSAIKTVDKAEKTIKQSATSSGKKTIKFAGKEATKTAQKSVKTAEQTAKTAIKTSQQAAKAAQKTAQATVKASQKAAQAAKATAKASREPDRRNCDV